MYVIVVEIGKREERVSVLVSVLVSECFVSECFSECMFCLSY